MVRSDSLLSTLVLIDRGLKKVMLQEHDCLIFSAKIVVLLLFGFVCGFGCDAIASGIASHM